MRLRKRDKKEIYRRRRGSILVQGGMDIKKTISGLDKGDYFNRDVKDFDTYIITEMNSKVWRIAFKNSVTGEVYKYRFREKMCIGRETGTVAEVRLVLPQDERISKVHCVIYEWGNSLVLADAGSKNHTWLNGQRIDGPVVLKNGDWIQIGNTRLCVEYGK